MSRIGNTPINIPEEVDFVQDKNQVTIKGPKGQLSHKLPQAIKITEKDNILTVTRANDNKQTKALHGLTRALIANNIVGVKDGYQKRLELVGTGYRVAKQGEKLTLSLGFSHPVEVDSLEGISFEIEGNNKIIVSGIDKQLVGQTAAEIRAIKKPEPYKGKGIRYEDEVVRRKPGKAAKVGAAGE